MSWAAAALAAICFGFGTVFEATAARHADHADHLDPRLLLRLFGHWSFVASIAVSALGVAATAVALRHLPLFTIQATLASSVAIAAVLAAVSHHEPLTREVQLGIGLICVGLGLLAISSGEQGAPDTSLRFRVTLVVLTVVALALAFLAGRRPGRSKVDVAILGATAGLLYGVGNIGLRVMRGFGPVDLVTDPAAWAAGIGGLGGVLVLATTLQRGSVALTAGSVTTAETVIPSLAGLVLLDERPRSGMAGWAVIGFLLAVAGAITLCRDVDPEPTSEPVSDVPEAGSGL